MNPDEILSQAYGIASQNREHTFIENDQIRQRIERICRSWNKSGARVALTCMLAKLHRPELDVRKPYTEIGDSDAFSGRNHYDEPYITPFNHDNDLGLNSTTAFLTPAFRNINYALTTDLTIEGRPRQLYNDLLQLLDDVYQARIMPDVVLHELIRILIVQRDDKRSRLASMLNEIDKSSEDALPPSSEMIIHLIDQHLSMKKASRLPVLIVMAAYQAAKNKLGEHALPLYSHNAADEQTGALGDIEICLLGEEQVITVYEMKDRPVTHHDIDIALTKISRANGKIDNYLFITTAEVDNKITEYAAQMYEQTFGIEIAILDCMGFVRHFLHLFHRLRSDFINAYQQLVLDEPESAVDQTLKEALLILRRNIESTD